jgi:hypothetical protein
MLYKNWNHNVSAAYDQWRTYDVEEERAAYEEFRFEAEMEWIESMIRMQHPYLQEEDVHALAHERYQSKFYDDIDF